MQIIKKLVLQALTTGITSTGSSIYHTIIPDTGATYFFKIGLVQETEDIGFFPVILNYYGYYYGYDYGYGYTYDTIDNAYGIGEALLFDS